MEEAHYRESRLCRFLGNPVVYQLVILLDAKGPTTPGHLAKLTGRSVGTISNHLGKLRSIDVVRYDSRGKETRYWLKHGRDIKQLLKVLRKVVRASSEIP
ncbi:MAG TPA: winged helix-turn-helix domain-containing protein [Candidatus Binatia bacterium]|jgi:DNA-binding transcriptional ArsR family regulator